MDGFINMGEMSGMHGNGDNSSDSYVDHSMGGNNTDHYGMGDHDMGNYNMSDHGIGVNGTDDYGMGDHGMGDYGMGENGKDDFGMGGDGVGEYGMGGHGMGGMGGHGMQSGRNRDGNIIINNNVNGVGCDKEYDSEHMVEKIAMAVVTKMREMVKEDMGMSYDKDGHHDED